MIRPESVAATATVANTAGIFIFYDSNLGTSFTARFCDDHSVQSSFVLPRERREILHPVAAVRQDDDDDGECINFVHQWK